MVDEGGEVSSASDGQEFSEITNGSVVEERVGSDITTEALGVGGVGDTDGVLLSSQRSAACAEETTIITETHAHAVGRVGAVNVEALKGEGVVLRLGNDGGDRVLVGDGALSSLSTEERVVHVGGSGVEHARSTVGVRPVAKSAPSKVW